MREFTHTLLFTRLYPETFPSEISSPENVKRVVFCSGKIYYELLETRRKEKVIDVALVRVEQLAPFPFDLVIDTLNEYPQAEVVWCQEEPANMGAWHHIFFHMRTALRHSKATATEPRYVGRHSAASPATGLHTVHLQEQQEIVRNALH